MKKLKERKIFFIVFLLSCSLQLVMMLPRVLIGIEISTITGFFLYFILTFFSFKIINHSLAAICVLELLGILVLQLPIRIISFDATSVTFVEFLYQLLAIPFGLAVYLNRKKSTPLIFLILIGLMTLAFSVYVNKIWKHKLDYGSFKYDVYYSPSSPIEGLDKYGNKVLLSSFKGKVLVLDFWNTNCAPCFKKFPILQQLSEKYQSNPDIVILAVNYPLKTDTSNQAYNMINDRGYTFKTIVLNNVKMIEYINVKYFPTTVVLNKKGIVVFSGDIEDSEKSIERELR